MSQEQGQQRPPTKVTFPVISRIAGINWSGDCRYVNADLIHASNLKLVGGVRYDIGEKMSNDTSSGESNGDVEVTLSSFLTFPNGNTKEVVMRGGKTQAGNSVRLDTTAEEGGPVYMLLTELAPDTILINEIEEATGKTILTSSISVVKGMKGTELIQTTHEVGDGKKTIEGHQVWRLSSGPIQYDDFDLRGTTGR